MWKHSTGWGSEYKMIGLPIQMKLNVWRLQSRGFEGLQKLVIHEL